jgi:sortase (surface protein transpeptidase)
VDPHVLGWWRAGARPGAGAGTIVVDGHVDSWRRGFGALFRLRELRPGDAVRVRDAAGRWHSYRVMARRQYSKEQLPSRQVFAQQGRERLVLITCGGSFDRATRQYADNVVVYALPVRA